MYNAHELYNYPYLHHDVNGQGFINFNTGEVEAKFNDDTVDPAQPTVTPILNSMVKIEYTPIGDDVPFGNLRMRCPDGTSVPLTLSTSFLQLTRGGVVSVRYESFGDQITNDEADLFLYCNGCHLLHI